MEGSIRIYTPRDDTSRIHYEMPFTQFVEENDEEKKEVSMSRIKSTVKTFLNDVKSKIRVKKSTPKKPKHENPNDSLQKRMLKDILKPDFKTLMDVLKKDEKKVIELTDKHPWVPIVMNWGMLFVMIFIVIGLFNWGLNIHIEKQSAALTATAMAEYQAEQDAIETARIEAAEAAARSEEAVMDRQANALAKLAYGTRNFEDKYGYGEDDYRRLFRCVMNRLEFGGYGNSLEDVIDQKDQWVGYSISNPVVDKYKKMALDFLKSYKEETSKPISNEYRFVVYTETGLFLSKEFNSKSPYSWYMG